VVSPRLIGPNVHIDSVAIVQLYENPQARPLRKLLVVVSVMAKADIAAFGDPAPTVDPETVRCLSVVPSPSVTSKRWAFCMRHDFISFSTR
jgi:hypothetical protein